MACSKEFFQDDDIVGGYDLKLVTEDKDISCSICLLLLREAMGTPCSHLFCKSCLQRLTKQVDVRNAQFPCPFCQEIVNEVVPNAFANRLVRGSDVFCQQRKADCPWKGSLASYFEKHDRECGYKIVLCENEGCMFSCERRSLQEHILECEYRIVQCEHCTAETKVIELNIHYSSCVRFPTACPHDGCSSIVARNEMEKHLNIQCLFVIIDCMYSTFGCTEKIKRRDMEKHNQSSMNHHMNLMFNQIVQSKNEINELRKKCTKFEIEVNNARQENTKLGNNINNLQERNTKTENQLGEQRMEVEKQKQEIEKQKAEIKELKDQLQNEVDKETYNIDELLSKGTEKWIRKKDVQCFDLDYSTWSTKIFDSMKENKLYKLNNTIYVKIKNEEKRSMIWRSNNREQQNEEAARADMYFHDDGLILCHSPGYLVIDTETLNDYNYEKKSTSFIMHPRHQENMICMIKDYCGEAFNQWLFRDIPNEIHVNDFLILCLTKYL